MSAINNGPRSNATISSSQSTMQKMDYILNTVFGYKEFRKGQRQVIENIMAGGDTIAVFPTGGGKSICYQIPALMLPGTSIVVSPLISLMKDQVDALTARGVAASYISSSLSDHEVLARIAEMKRGRLKIVYVAPERFYSENFLLALKSIHIPFIAIDEAHCVSQWGHNFRPAYLKIKDLIQCAGNAVTAAFTATANKKVQEDIARLLELSDCKLYISSFDRPNLEFRVEKPKDGKQYILTYTKRYSGKAGIIYCATRKNVEEIYYYLKNNGIVAGMYHAGLSSEQRNVAQDGFIKGTVPVIVATNAFGMGIDKSNVRFIIHLNMPKSIENYYQEAGRAGRDGLKSICILLKSQGDYRLNKFLIECNYPPIKTVERVYRSIAKRGAKGLPIELLTAKNSPDYKRNGSAIRKLAEYNYINIRGGIAYVVEDKHFKLSQQEIDTHLAIEMDKLDTIEKYVEEKCCLRAYILRYFNENTAIDKCGNCSACIRSEENQSEGLLNKLLHEIFMNNE